jgi:DNA polymerase III alpha subunit
MEEEMSNTLCLFKSHYSLRSILSLEEKGKSKENGPDIIIDIAAEQGFKSVWLCEDTLSGIIEAYKNLKSIGCNLNFGLRLDICADLNEKTTESLARTSRIVVWINGGEQGYYDLIKIHNLANTTGFYKDGTEKYSRGRIDYANLQRLWTKNLSLSIPFYDSYIFKNLLERGQCIPEFGDIQPTVFIEKQNLPFDSLVENAIETAADKNWERVKVKSIYYKKREDFDAYLCYRAIQKRGTFAKPNLNAMASAEFSFESWLEYEK